MKTYQIQRVNLPEDVALDSPLWEGVEEAAIDSYIWDEGVGYRPKTTVRLLATDGGISLLFCTDEAPLTAKTFEHNGPIWCDSCVEFFVQPNPEKSPLYFNFEMNCMGKLLLGVGPERHGRTPIEYEEQLFRIRPRLQDGVWTHRLYVPYEFFLRYVDEMPKVFRGNLNKCGDETEHPHFGTWNPIDFSAVPTPDFHVPNYFGTFVIADKE